jgi:hypothetical protein
VREPGQSSAIHSSCRIDIVSTGRAPYLIQPLVFHGKSRIARTPCFKGLSGVLVRLFHAFVGRLNTAKFFTRHNSAYVRLRPSIVIIITLYVIVNRQIMLAARECYAMQVAARLSPNGPKPALRTRATADPQVTAARQKPNG